MVSKVISFPNHQQHLLALLGTPVFAITPVLIIIIKKKADVIPHSYYKPYFQNITLAASIFFIQFHFNLTKHMNLRRKLFRFLLCS